MNAGDAGPPLAEPPEDLARIKIPLVELRADEALYRIHRLKNEPLWFGTGRHPVNRFDDARGEFGVCYFGRTREAAFAETFLRQPPVRLLSREFIDTLGFAEFSVRRSLRVVQSYGPGLARLGATSAVASGPYEVTRRWSRAFWQHPSAPDGIQYRCRHDDAEMAIALYDRAAESIGEEQRFGIRADTVWFGSVLERYGVGLDD